MSTEVNASDVSDKLWSFKAILRLADQAKMADAYWQADRVITVAREKLGVPVDGRYTHAHLWAKNRGGNQE